MKFIPVNEPLLDGNEKKYLQECIETGWISSEGPFVKELEEKFAERCGRKHGISVCNGTAALDCAVQALKIGNGDEVIIPSFTIISCASAVTKAGAVPVLVDSMKDTWNMDVSQIRGKITSKTKAIMAVHIYGQTVDMDPLMELAKDFNLKVIEDAAEVIGQTYKGKPCGSFGDISTFSFYPNKHITTGEGGMMLTDEKDLAERCSSIRNLCFEPARRFVHNEIGHNFRMTNLQAAVGKAQLERLDEFIEKKRHIGKLYREYFKGNSFFELQTDETDYAKNIYWVFGIVLNEKSGMNAIQAMDKLKEKGIGTRPFFYPMHLQPVYLNSGLFKDESYPVAEKLSGYGFYIPSGLALTDEQIMTTAEAVNSLFK